MNRLLVSALQAAPLGPLSPFQIILSYSPSDLLSGYETPMEWLLLYGVGGPKGFRDNPESLFSFPLASGLQQGY